MRPQSPRRRAMRKWYWRCCLGYCDHSVSWWSRNTNCYGSCFGREGHWSRCSHSTNGPYKISGSWDSRVFEFLREKCVRKNCFRPIPVAGSPAKQGPMCVSGCYFLRHIPLCTSTNFAISIALLIWSVCCLCGLTDVNWLLQRSFGASTVASRTKHLPRSGTIQSGDSGCKCCKVKELAEKWAPE